MMDLDEDQIGMNINEACYIPQYLTEKEVASRLGISAAALRKWRLSQYGPVFLRLGSRVVYPADKLAQWLASRPKGGEPAKETETESGTIQ